MSDSSEQPGTPADAPTATQTGATSAAPAWTPPAGPQDLPPAADAGTASGGPAALVAERPEVAVGAAFAGGLVFALILKRLAR